MEKLEKRIREVEENHAEEILAEHIDEHRKRSEQAALVLLGGIRATDRIASALSSESVRAMIRFQEAKMHEALGYATFVEFLTESEFAPMTKPQFYDRKALLEKEGDVVFDLMNELGISVRRRKLLGKGNVEIDGDNAIIRDAEGQETIVPVNDHARLMEVVTAVVDAKLDLQHKFERQKEKIEKHDDKVRGLYEEIDRVKAAKAAEIGKDPHSMALANLCFAFAALRDEIANLTVVDCEARCSNTLEILAGQMTLTSRAYGGSGDWAAEVAESNGDRARDDDLLQMLADVDLSGKPGDNDAELAASM